MHEGPAGMGIPILSGCSYITVMKVGGKFHLGHKQICSQCCENYINTKSTSCFEVMVIGNAFSQELKLCMHNSIHSCIFEAIKNLLLPLRFRSNW